MKLIANINQYGYKAFLNSMADILMIALKDYSSSYFMDYELKDIPAIIKEIHDNNKQVYLSLNKICNEETIKKFEKDVLKIKDYDFDGIVVSDFGMLQILKEQNLINKAIFNPITTITNKYNANIANNLGIDHVCLANELNIKDLIEISNYNNGNVEVLAQGYYQICNSKRPLLTNFFKNFKINNSSPLYYIKEESRDYAYPIIELNNETLIYIDKQRCILPYLKDLLATNIKYLRIDTIFIDLEESLKLIELYKQALTNINVIEENLDYIKNHTNSNLKCLDNISILKKEKENG